MGYVFSTAQQKSGEPGPPGESLVYEDNIYENVSGFTLNTGISPVPMDPSIWKVYRNGVRLAYRQDNGDWWIDSGNTIRFFAETFNDLIVISHPVQA